MREQPEQQAPPVMRLRLRYAKRGRMRFASHRDFSRAFERALMRAKVPMAYSSGFNPHPRLSYAGAAPTGAASEAEYVEIALAEKVDPEELLAHLGAVMPPGLDLVSVKESPGGALADGLLVSDWAIDVAEEPADLASWVADFEAAETAPTRRMTKRGMREFDARSAVLVIEVADPGLRLVIEHDTPAVRPDDVLKAMAELSGFTWSREPLLTRTSQGTWDPAQRVVTLPF